MWQAGHSPDVQGEGLVLNGHILLLGGCAAGAEDVHNLPGKEQGWKAGAGARGGSPEENVAGETFGTTMSFQSPKNVVQQLL